MGFQVAYIPIGTPTFHLESAQIEFDNSIEMLKNITDKVVFPENMLLTINDLVNYLDTINPDLIVLQNITFANAAYANEVLKRFKCPIILWTLREPVIDGGRLRLNSLTGAYSAGNMIKAHRNEKFEYVFGTPKEDEVINTIKSMVSAAEIKSKLRNLKIAAIGHTPMGFGFGRGLDSEMSSVFGSTLESIEARELIELAKTYSDDEIKEYYEEANSMINGLDTVVQENKINFLKLYKAYSTFIEENNIGALASRCWPDFFTSFGTPVCSVLSVLNAKKIPSSCESDIYGALSMYIGTEFTKESTFFGDPVSMDEENNTITFWHCGMAACNLALEETGATVGVHPNRKIGPVMDFGCRPCEEVTIFRISRKPCGTFRFFVAEGEALNYPKQFCGTTVVVKTKNSAKDVVYNSVKAGFEPHFVVVYGNIKKELELLANMLGIEVENF